MHEVIRSCNAPIELRFQERQYWPTDPRLEFTIPPELWLTPNVVIQDREEALQEACLPIGWRIYTDGSGRAGLVGFAFVVYDQQYSVYKMGAALQEGSVYEAEMAAIREALLWVEDAPFAISETKSVKIFCDNQQVLKALKHPTTSSALLRPILDQLYLLQQQGWHTALHWVPSHSGVEGNEYADQEAKKALSLPPRPRPITQQELKRLIKHENNAELSLNWKEASTAPILHRFFPDLSDMKILQQLNISVPLIKLMAGRSSLKFHQVHHFRLDISSLCSCSQEEEDVDHFIFRCPLQEHLRTDWEPKYRKGILSEFTRTTDSLHLLDSYVLATKRFREFLNQDELDQDSEDPLAALVDSSDPTNPPALE